jgi:hypothetical protein
MLYRSKKDWWLVLLVWSAILLPFALGVYHLLNTNKEAGWYLLFVGVVTGAVVLWLTYPLNYEITASTLIVRSGFMQKEILLASIEEVCPTKNPLSAPAWSLDRLYVSYRDGALKSMALISPENKGAFMRELTERAVGLEVQGECVVRVS